MKIETEKKGRFRPWTVGRFHPMEVTVTYTYDRRGKQIDVELNEFWLDMVGDSSFARIYSWSDEGDRKLLQTEMPFLKKPEHLEQLGGPNESDQFFLHAIDASGKSVAIALDEPERYDIYPDPHFRVRQSDDGKRD